MKKIRVKISEEKKESIERQMQKMSKFYSYDSIEMSIEDIVESYKKGGVYLPIRQKKLDWSKEQQSEFVESIILNIQIFPFIFVESEKEEEKVIIDGYQRINSLCSFLSNKLKLTELKVLTKLNGCFFKDLFLTRQKRIKKKSLKVILFTKETDFQTRVDLFNRVNIIS